MTTTMIATMPTTSANVAATMTRTEAMASMESEIAAEIIGLVPQWYQAECGPHRYWLTVGENRECFYNHRRLTPALEGFLSHMQKTIREIDLHYFERYPGLLDVLLEGFAKEWLRIQSPRVNWKSVVRYFDRLSNRTFENQPVAMNLVIRQGEGQGDITQPHFQKVFDQLASSPYCFLAVDSKLRLIEYGEVEWSQVRTPLGYKHYPEFLHPIHGVLREGDVSVHLTMQGDLIFMNRDGLLAARRKRKWRVYDVRTFKNSLAQCLAKDAVGANLFEVVFDLSFRRYGALLIYDPKHVTRKHVRNEASIVYQGWKGGDSAESEAESGQTLIGRSMEDLAMGEGLAAMRKKRRLVELARVDGAVIFDDNRLLAVGAIIQAHPCVGNQLGARSTAARSAYLWGAHPVKVSSDGDVTVYFTSRKGNDQCEAEMHFL